MFFFYIFTEEIWKAPNAFLLGDYASILFHFILRYFGYLAETWCVAKEGKKASSQIRFFHENFPDWGRPYMIPLKN